MRRGSHPATTAVTAAEDRPARSFRPLKIVVPLVLVFGAIPFYARWYGQQSLNSRYCADIGGALSRLAHIVTDDRPAGDGERRPYLITAKLLYFVPRRSDEALADYLARVRHRLEELCRR